MQNYPPKWLQLLLVFVSGFACDIPSCFHAVNGLASAQAATLTLRIDNDENDKGQDGSTIDATGHIDLFAGDEWGALRFQHVNLPRGATINSAILTIYPVDSNDDNANAFLDFQQIDDAPALTNTANDISNRWSETGNKVTWQQSNLGTGPASSPELNNALQAIIDRPGWTMGNAIVLLLDHTGSNSTDLEITGYGQTPSRAATLDIDYTALTLSGRIYEDVDGDGDVLDDGANSPNVRVLLYEDDGDGEPGAGDPFLISTRTDSNGQYSFDVGDGTHWVVVDAKTISPFQGFHDKFSPDHVWAEQTYGAAGSTSSNGVTFSFSNSDGAFFGGMQGEVADNAATLATSEHVIRVIVAGSNVTGVDAGFSFNTITNTTDSVPIDPFPLAAAWSTFDAGAAGIGRDPDGFSEAVYDGRYVYFVPFNDGTSASGEVLRYDTRFSPVSRAAWTMFDADSAGVGTDPDGYAGGVFDGRYVYFAPWDNGSGRHGEVLRYDIQGDFHTAASWSTFDPGANGLGSDPDGYEGIEFDGRYLYFAPYFNGSQFHSEILRYDTQAAFNALTSWAIFDPFSAGVTIEAGGYDGVETDGRYIYFVPFEDGGGHHGEMLRYDTQATFSDPASWQAYDPGANGVGIDTDGYSGAIFDGRYLYYTPLHNGTDFHGEVLRYDTQGAFDNATSWIAFNPGANGVGSIAVGYLDQTFDGRYIYFAPYLNSIGNHGEVLRYDTRAAFQATDAWMAFNPGANGVGTDPRGYWGAVFDGRYVHFVPLRTEAGEHGEVLILDTARQGSGQGSLRQFTLNSNAIMGLNSSQFAIPTTDSGYNATGNGEYTIQPMSALPALTDAVILDGTTQTGFVDQPIIELNGTSAGVNVSGLIMTAGGSTAKGLVINRFTGYGIALLTNGNNTIQNNFIGTRVGGHTASLNETGGLLIGGSDSNIIGGTSAATRNVISGNEPVGIHIFSGSELNLIQGNFIGTNVDGTSGIANIGYGMIIDGAPNNSSCLLRDS